MWRLPKPRFRVLIYGPQLPSAGLPGFAHFEPGILVLEGRRHWFTIQFAQVDLETGGYDGRQWMLAWQAHDGPMRALLQGGDAIDLFIRLAPPELAERLHLARRARGSQRMRKWLAMLALLALLSVLGAGMFWSSPLR